MEKNLQNWSSATKSVYTSMLIYQVGFLAYWLISSFRAVGGGLRSAASALNSAVSAATGQSLFSSGLGFWGYLQYICLILAVVGAVMFFMNLGKWMVMLNEKDQKGVKSIRTGIILVVIALLLVFVRRLPLSETIAWILNTIGFLMMFMGYNTLKISDSLSADATRGASKLSVAAILLVIAALFVYLFSYFSIPVLSWLIKAGLFITAFIMMFSGWGAIKNSAAPEKK